MHYRAFWFSIASMLLAAAALPAAPTRPNILYIMADDHGYQALSCYGSKIIQTPNLDRLAKEGMRFDNCFCTNSICGPSRAVILTGKYSHLNGFLDNSNCVFDGSQPNVAKYLQAAGYQTAMIGKWHLVSDPTGFDYWNILPGQGAYYDPVLIEMGKRKKHEGYVTDIITDLTLDFLEKKRDPAKPFFVMYHHKAPHRNWQPGPKYKNLFDEVEIPEPETFNDDYAGRGAAARAQKMRMEDLEVPGDTKIAPPPGLEGAALKKWKYQRFIKDYLRCVASVDENVGRVLNYLDRTGLAKNTLVFYASDQGFYLGEHGWFDKRFMYEESLRMPLLVRWPGHVKPGSTSGDFAMNLDFAATFLDCAGLPVPADMQGRSLAPLLEGRTPADWRKSIYYRYYEFPGPHNVHKQFGVRNDRYKLICFNELNEWELYDLQKDPRELHSVYDDPDYKDVLGLMKAELQRLKDQYRDDDGVTGSRKKTSPAVKPQMQF
ncbi:MAG: sulfatase [Pirellulales bacterium]|nr:sulfatase [Pirellulales bacterium]